MYVEKWVIVVLIFAFLGLLTLCLHFAKQVRAMRFCFINYSDWSWRQIDEIHEYLEATVGKDEADSVREIFTEGWNEELKYIVQVMGRANLRKPSIEDTLYPLEN